MPSRAPRRKGSGPKVHLALCQVDLSADAKPPEWVQLVPAGREVPTLDGRLFRNSDPAAIVNAFRDYPLDVPIDWEHASEIRAPQGNEAPAAGWIKDLEIRDGSIWGRVEWTPRGVASLTNREYRYISPAFYHNADGVVLELVSAGLTNKPAFSQLAAVASQQTEESMNPEILKLLGLDEKADAEQVLAAVKQLQADKAKAASDLTVAQGELATARASQPSLDKFVPRADYDAALARAQKAEKDIEDSKAAAHKAAVDAEIDAALKAGKITPATVEYHRASCQAEGGLERFKAFCSAAPVVAPDSGIQGKPAGTEGDVALTDEQLAIANNLGLTKDRLVKALKS